MGILTVRCRQAGCKYETDSVPLQLSRTCVVPWPASSCLQLFAWRLQAEPQHLLYLHFRQCPTPLLATLC